LRGAIAAAVLFVLPAALLLWVLSVLYAYYGNIEAVQTVFAMVRPAVLAIITAALVRMARHHLGDGRAWFMAVAAFVAMFFFSVPFPWIVVFALGLGLITRASATKNVVTKQLESARTPWRAAGLILVLWIAPILLAVLFFGAESLLVSLGLFFSKTALVTFGGAYAVLPYVVQGAVEQQGWLTAPQMIDGLALGETTPGPLIMVVAFVGFLGGWQKEVLGPDALWAAGVVGACVATFFTFLPSFLFILAGGPLVEATRGRLGFTAPLTAVTAAVVGVIASLALFFASHTFWPTGLRGPLDVSALALAAAAALALMRFKVDTMKVLMACALAGCAAHLLGLRA